MTPTEVLEFWLGPAPDDPESVARAAKRWYITDDGFDAEIRGRFGAAIEQTQRGAFAGWAETPEGALALVILLDQFPRNAYRGTADAFAGDPVALAVARRAVEHGFDRELAIPGRAFLYHPFEHSEHPADQARSVVLFESLAADAPPRWREFAADFVPYAHAHRDVIARFGRFPHRNAILGRASTAEEQAYLDRGGGF
ncbi:MAG: DUF924 domain-containing protein [Gammaproteobacteria bacterium]|nr:DUF924 domain-containing protein [Gammaproteobacteria bacterium]MDE0442044.1 DUF924 domain-containing protein [Gammaproteobacteria bacterium]